MRVPFSWLTEYCDPGLAPEEVAELLSMRAVEVERIDHAGAPSADGYVVGRVRSAETHPNADRLSVCTVDTGDGERTIVCGAPNVAAGQTVAVALPGTVMPGGETLGRAELRGVVSDGMILSETELAIGEDAEGIMVLESMPAASSSSTPGAAGSPPGLAPGTPLSAVLPVSEPVLVLELNPNRPDCLGVYGVAREVAAITGAELAPPPWSDDAEPTGEGSVTDLASVRVDAPELCPRFTARAFTSVALGPSPPWLKARLAAAGQRSISNVVDATNYVMLMTAQPLHAFDLDKVPGGEIVVRTATDGETMTTLDGEERRFDADTVLVCDRNGPSGIAGIMGGQVSEVSEETTRVLLEVATWNGVNILRTSNFLGLRTEASARFEKQLHPELALRGQRVASRLITELTGAELVPGTIDEAAAVPAPHVVSLHGARLDSLLGVEIDRDEARTHLERLGFEVTDSAGDVLEATVPLHRHYDVEREVDLIEEVGRLHGFDTLPRTLPAHGDRSGGLDRAQRLRRRAEDLIRDLGFDEIRPWSFNSAELADGLRLGPDDPRRHAVATGNPISTEHSRLRTTLLGGLLDVARHNLARGAERVALFESGRAYLAEPVPGEGGPLAGAFAGKLPAPVREPHRLACLLVGTLRPPSWRESAEPAGFYEAKGVLEALCAQLDTELTLTASDEPFLHPGRAAAVALGDAGAGWLGELHPLVARAWDLPSGAGFEIDLAPLIAGARTETEAYEDVTTNPAAVEDIAIVADAELAAERIREVVLEAGGELLRSATVFDVYEGEQLGEGKRSLALRLSYRAPDRTLTDEEVAERRQRIKEALARIGGSLRE